MSDPAPFPSRRVALALTPQQADDLRQIWREHAAPLQAMLRRWCGNDADGADALQELFLRLARTPRLVLSAADPRAFLVVTARRIAIDASRRRQAGQRREEQLASSGTLTELGADARSDADLHAAIARAVRALAPEQRGVFEARFLQGLTLAEIAEAQGISINTAASRFRYALDKIRAELRPYYDDMNKTQPTSPVSAQSASPAAADQARLIRALEPKRVPSVAPGLEGFAALAPDDAHFESTPVEIVDHGIDESLLPEVSDCGGIDGGLIAIDLVVGEEAGTGEEVTEEFVGEEVVEEGEVVEDGLGEEEYTGEEFVVGEFVDENSGCEWLGEIDPQIFVCWVFDGSEEPGDGFGKPEISVCWFEGVDVPEVNVEDYFTFGGEDSSGEGDGDDLSSDGEGETDGEVYEPTAQDFFQEYEAFLADNPDWLAESGIGEIQAQVITSSSYFEELELANPGAAKAFDLWYADNYLTPVEFDGEVQDGEVQDGGLVGGVEPKDGVMVDGIRPEVLYSTAGGDRGGTADGIQPNYRGEVVASEGAIVSSPVSVSAVGSSETSDPVASMAEVVHSESIKVSGLDSITLDASASAAEPLEMGGFVFTDLAFETPATVTELHHGAEETSVASTEDFVPAQPASLGLEGTAGQDAVEAVSQAETASVLAASGSPVVAPQVVVAQAAMVGGIAVMAAPSVAKKRVPSAVR
jgi:RNA polymerase sigma-70 factor (ECF subfamily)